MDFICPNSPGWDSSDNADCLGNIVFPIAGNIVTVVALVALRISARNRGITSNGNLHWSMKFILHILPASGAFLSLYEIFLLVQSSLQGDMAKIHYWLYRCSQLISWMVILLALKMDSWFHMLCIPIMCFWWVIKPMLEIPHLLSIFSSSELKVLTCFKESSSVLLQVMFGLFVNICRAMRASNGRSDKASLEDLLVEEGQNAVNDTKTFSLLDLLTFKFVNSMIDLGVTRQLDFNDLAQLPSELLPSSCHDRLLICWFAENDKQHSHMPLFRAMYSAYGSSYLRLGLLKVINDALNFVGPLLLNKLIQFLQQGSGGINGYILALSLGLTSVFKSFLDTQYSFRLLKLKLMLRSSIMTLVYRKCLRVSLAERLNFSEGEVQTFMSIDTDRTVNMCNSLHDGWSLPLQIGVALYLLYTQVNFAFVAGVVITILLIPVNKWISSLIATATEEMMKQKDERIRSAGELLTYIRTIKMYSWEQLFTKSLMEKRVMEVKHLSTRKYLDAWCVFFWATTPTLFSLFTFGIFTLTGHSLDAATVFTCVALFNTLISPLNSFPWVINGLIDSVISIKRLSRFLCCPEHNSEHLLAPTGYLPIYVPPYSCATHATGSDTSAIIFQDACFAWSNDQVQQKGFLKGISLSIPNGQVVAIIGEIGSGKSSLLNSILGEMQTVHGLVTSYGPIAYVPQVPWIISGSVRDNILLGKDFDQERYAEVLQACALDIDISRMNGGDLAYIGEKGLNLSGGQRARLALARAVYHNPCIYLLDDVLSAVDSQVGRWILNRTILGPLMNQRTRIICTHSPQAIAVADMVIVMKKGYIEWAGTSSGFLTTQYSIVSLPKDFECSSSQSLDKENEKSVLPKLSPDFLLDHGCIVSEAAKREDAEVETRKEGKVEISVYKSYGSFASWPVVILICISASLMQVSRNGNDLWLSHWVDATAGAEHTGFYLLFFFIFGFVNSLFTLARAFSFAYGGLRAAIQVHTELLSKLINAPVIFFYQNQSGRILNRLSSDLYTIDDSLPFILNILLANWLSLLGVALVLIYSQVVFLILLVPLWYIYSKLQLYYRCTSRELRRLDSVSRSPIYSSFSETLDGSSTIRAFGKEGIFMDRFLEHVSLYQQTSYAEATASFWLSLRLQLLAAFIILFIAVMAVLGGSWNYPLNFITPGLVGLALSYASPIVSLLSGFLTSFTETEKEMVSVERVVEYMNIPQETLQGSISVLPNWPSQGQIDFEHVVLKYRPSLPAALQDVSFSIPAGMQVAIVGRTGAGKSSIFNALFRLAPICSGRILVDGLDIVNVAVRDLRGRFAVVPQTPFLFEGSLRENLDPSGITSDLRIWEVLEKCHMKAEVLSAGGLDIHIKGGQSFSVGQQQLFCLARAILKSSKILCLDECTANVDNGTAMVLQRTIARECVGMTVVTIAHRIPTVLNMDNILVLDHGMLVEQGNPEDLVKDGNSQFSSFVRASMI